MDQIFANEYIIIEYDDTTDEIKFYYNAAELTKLEQLLLNRIFKEEEED